MSDANYKNNDSSTDSRKAALNTLLMVLKEGQSLSSLAYLTEKLEPRDAAFARMLSFGVLRYYEQLQALLKPLVKKPLRSKDLDVQLVILIAIYQLIYTRVPDFAVVDVAVKQVRKSKKKWAANLVNAVLRNYLRQSEGKQPEDLANELHADEARYSHPQWIIDRLKLDWPDCWQEILQANNKQAPMTLRINQQRVSVDDYISELKNDFELDAEKIADIPAALKLQQPRDVRQLPGFSEGWFSVQDAGAQLAAQILQPVEGDNILDACAAPGGKTAHLFEFQPDIQLTALDISATRLERVNENCQRLGFKPVLKTADATEVESWWQGELFDKILLDVPCSAIGVIRRHPDIKHLRWEEDIASLVQLQREILMKNWALLKPGGQLLYATCSLFKAENEEQIEWFLNHMDDSELAELPGSVLHLGAPATNASGMQLFPLNGNTDGFYYALLRKKKAV